MAVATELDDEPQTAGGGAQQQQPASSSSSSSSTPTAASLSALPAASSLSSSSSSPSSPFSPLSSRHIGSNCAAFLSWLQSVTAALSFFGHHAAYRQSAAYVKKLSGLQRRGLQECDRELSSLLQQHSRPLDVTRLGWPVVAQQLELLPPSIARQLAAIAGCMSGCGVTSFASHIVAARSAALRASVKKAVKEEEGYNPLREQEEARGGEARQQQDSKEREESLSAGSSLHSTSAAAPRPPSTPQHLTAASAAASLSLPGSLSVKDRERLEERRRHELYRRRTHAILFHFLYFLSLLQPERELLRALLQDTSLSEEENRDEFARLQADVCRESALYLLRKEDERVRAWAKVEFRPENRILALLDIALEMTLSLLPQLRLFFPRPESIAPFVDFQSLLMSTLRRQLQEYAAYIAGYDEDKTLQQVVSGGGRRQRRDGSVHVLTIEVLMLVRQLGDYRDSLQQLSREQQQSILPEQAAELQPALREKAERERQQRDRRERDEAAEFERSRQKGKVSASQLEQHRQRERERERRAAREQLRAASQSSMYSSLVAALLSWLEASLDSRARALKSGTLAAVFLLNNFQYIARFVQRHQPSLQLQPVAAYYALATQHSILDYRSGTWDRLLALLPSAADCEQLAADLQRETAGGGDRAKKAIKAVFAGFNGGLEELYASQRLFSVSDAQLRAELRSGNVQLVLPRYRAVWERLSALPFTTKPSKYAKYTPAVAESMIRKFFDEEE